MYHLKSVANPIIEFEKYRAENGENMQCLHPCQTQRGCPTEGLKKFSGGPGVAGDVLETA